jgi:two-component system cell cycle sensor histidine kinase/response regulator CckA
MQMAKNKDKIETDPLLFRDLISKTNDAIFVNDPKTGRFIFVNDKACTGLGYDRQELLRMGVKDIETTFSDNFSWRAHVDELRQRGPLVLEGIHKRKDGTTFPVEANISYVLLSTGEYMVAVVRDITERKRMEDQLQQTERRYRQLFENMNEGFLIQDIVEDDAGKPVDVRYLDINPAIERFLGKTRSEIIGRTRNQVLGSPDPAVVDTISRVAATGQPIHMVRYSSGANRWYESISYSLGQGQVATLVLDVTERKQAEEARQTALANLEALVDNVQQGVLFEGQDRRIRFANRTFCSLFGIPSSDLIIGADCAAIAQQAKPVFADPDGFVETIEQRLRDRQIVLSEEVKLADGRMFERDYIPILAGEAQLGNYWIYRDITERERADAALRERERQLSESQRIAHIGSWEHNLATGEVVWSDELFRIIGFDPRKDPADFKMFFGMVHPDDRPALKKAIDETVKTGKHFSVDYRFILRDGTTRILHAQAELKADETGAQVILSGTAQDITEKHLLEEERLKTHKLESIGTLAGGIAHDFNNLLQGIFGYISMAKMTIDQKEKSLSMLDQAEEALHMSVNLTTQLLTFSKGGRPVKKLIRVRPAVENAVKFALSGSRTNFEMYMPADVWPIEADEGQLAQVIQNIALNANEAMAGSGTVLVSLANVNIVKGAVAGLPEGGRYVRITIQDSGIGIPEQNLARIFDPYFTTKQKGSGLGLATSYSIIKKHGGVIEVKSALNRGTTFTMYLPASEGAEMEIARTTSHAVGTKKGRILLMDDEELVRNVAREMLAALGHDVVSAEDGRKAIELFREARAAGTPFDLVILDLTVKGGMGGEEAIRKIRDIDPDVKAVVASGYADSPVIANYRAYGFSAVLNKPYRIDALQNCLNLFVS